MKARQAWVRYEAWLLQLLKRVLPATHDQMESLSTDVGSRALDQIEFEGVGVAQEVREHARELGIRLRK